MSIENLRCEGDRTLSKKLLSDSMVQQTKKRLQDDTDLNHPRVRRHLLATALRVTPSMSPDLHATVAQCAERLEVKIPLELYVYPAPQFNAACVKPEDGRLFILLSSSLLEAFKGAELTFVIGHELGHHVFDHHAIPIRPILEAQSPPAPPALALKLFAWSRYAEISADRAGALCAKDADAVARALFRLASGLSGTLGQDALLQVNIDDFAKQADDMKIATSDDKGAPESDWFSTHPFSPLRLKAAKLFFGSSLYDGTRGDDAALEAGVRSLMSVMEPGYLKERSEEAEIMRRLLFAAAIAVIDADGQITEQETEIFEQFFGEDALSDSLDVGAIKKSLADRIDDANQHIAKARRIQVVRDVCTIARAEQQIGDAERAVLDDLATRLQVPAAIVEQALYGSLTLD